MTRFMFTSYGTTAHWHKKTLEGIYNFSIFLNVHDSTGVKEADFPNGNTLFYFALINRFEINFSFSMDLLILQLI